MSTGGAVMLVVVDYLVGVDYVVPGHVGGRGY